MAHCEVTEAILQNLKVKIKWCFQKVPNLLISENLPLLRGSFSVFRIPFKCCNDSFFLKSYLTATDYPETSYVQKSLMK